MTEEQLEEQLEEELNVLEAKDALRPRRQRAVGSKEQKDQMHTIFREVTATHHANRPLF
jgi:hypothetical protein